MQERTGRIPDGEIPIWIRKTMATLIGHAENRRLAYMVLSFGVSDRDTTHDYVALFHRRKGMRHHAGRALMRVAMALLGQRSITVELSNEIASQPLPTSMPASTTLQ